jgi:hypothetical protein
VVDSATFFFAAQQFAIAEAGSSATCPACTVRAALLLNFAETAGHKSLSF